MFKKFFNKRESVSVDEIALRLALRLWDLGITKRCVTPFIKSRQPKKWVFLVGCYNSGTTLMRELLACHPRVCALPREGARLASDLPRPEDKGWTRMWLGCEAHMRMPEPCSSAIVERIMRHWSPWWRGDGDLFLEKSITNVTRMKWLDDNFPNAYFIGITRNGYCAAEGILRRAAPKGEARDVVGDRYSSSMAAQQWVAANELLDRGAGQVQRYFGITYEELAVAPDVVLDRIWQFLEIERPYSELDESGISIQGHHFPIANRNSDSIGRLKPEEISEMNPVLAPMQCKLGYEVIT